MFFTLFWLVLLRFLVVFYGLLIVVEWWWCWWCAFLLWWLFCLCLIVSWEVGGLLLRCGGWNFVLAVVVRDWELVMRLWCKMFERFVGSTGVMVGKRYYCSIFMLGILVLGSELQSTCTYQMKNTNLLVWIAIFKFLSLPILFSFIVISHLVLSYLPLFQFFQSFKFF